MSRAPITNLRSKQHREKPKASLRERALRALNADFELHGEDAIKQLRETRPDRYVELAARPAEVITSGYADCNSMQEIGLKLLQSVKFNNPDEDSIAEAIKANDDFIAKLEAIRDRAGVSDEELQ